MPTFRSTDSSRWLILVKNHHLLSKTISKDNWSQRGKKKLTAGPGFFQQNYVKKNSSGITEPWQRVGIIPWGGEIHLPTGKVIQIVNSCTVSPFLQMFYALHTHEIRKRFDCDHPIVKHIYTLYIYIYIHYIYTLYIYIYIYTLYIYTFLTVITRLLNNFDAKHY